MFIPVVARFHNLGFDGREDDGKCFNGVCLGLVGFIEVELFLRSYSLK